MLVIHIKNDSYSYIHYPFNEVMYYDFLLFLELDLSKVLIYYMEYIFINVMLKIKENQKVVSELSFVIDRLYMYNVKCSYIHS